jgi:DNA-binding beta-propeller fold protein YncE
MRSFRESIVWFWPILVVLSSQGALGQVSTNSFVNWETAPVHPVAVSPGGNVLAVCNLPDNRVEFFDLSSPTLRSLGSVMVGLDPVSVRFWSDDEVWVANFISDSISIVDPAALRVISTLDTPDEPSDIIFAGSPVRAFVSCSAANSVRVIDPSGRQTVATVDIDGQGPRAMAAAADGSAVYVAIFRSGNASTILGAGIGQGLEGSTVVDLPQGPHQGRDPPPNAGTMFVPPVSTNLPTGTKPPRVGLIVKKNSAGHWMDDNHGDWTVFVAGTNAVFSGRPEGCDLPDHDMAVLNPDTLDVHYLSGLMNICMDVAVNPASGQVTVVGTDALNERRFEPNLKGVFLRVNLALVDPASPGQKQIVDLNPHLDYSVSILPEAERQQSIGDPRGIVWNALGTRAYVTGMGSGNLLLLDAQGRRVQSPIQSGDGPSGMAVDDKRHRLYVLNRFAATISVVDTEQATVVQTVPMFDPTPAVIKAGRKQLYDTHRTSGLGQIACASCHVDAQMDGLAWDLGNPQGDMKHITSASHNFARFPPAVTNDFHPMKGPMVTQTLQDIIGHEPFHWRGDRLSIEEFNQTFRNLQGTDAEIAPSEMTELKAFLATIAFPPNPFRKFDNSLPTSLRLTGHFALGRGTLPRGAPLPNGNAQAGLFTFRNDAQLDCIDCHTLPAGLGPDLRFIAGRWTSVPLGPNGEHHAALIALNRSDQLPFKIPQLRNAYRKVGADFLHSTSRAGFGFTHDGSVDSLTRFVQDAFPVRADQETADLVAFLLCFSGSDLPAGSVTDPVRAPGLSSRDVPAGVGKQVTINQPTGVSLLDQMLALAQNSANRVDLVARGPKDGVLRGWFFDRTVQQFQSDRAGESISPDDLRALAQDGNELTFTVVPAGTGRRIGIDRDDDGFPDRTEIESGSDPASARSVPGNTAPVIASAADQTLAAGASLTLTVSATDPDVPRQQLSFGLGADAPPGAIIDGTSGVFQWQPDISEAPGIYRVSISVTDDGSPSLSDSTSFRVLVTSPDFLITASAPRDGVPVLLWEAVPGKTYRLQFKDQLGDQAWTTLGPNILATTRRMTNTDVSSLPARGARFYQVQLVE